MSHNECAKLLNLVEAWLHVRAARRRHFSIDLFNDPAFDILLYTYIAHQKGAACLIDDLVPQCGASRAITKRWLGVLGAQGLIEMKGGLVDLTSEGVGRLESALLDAAGQQGRLGLGSFVSAE